jgi:hypothetical protein
VRHPRQAERPEGRDTERHRARNVPERVAAAIAIRAGVGQLSDACAIEDDQDDSAGPICQG